MEGCRGSGGVGEGCVCVWWSGEWRGGEGGEEKLRDPRTQPVRPAGTRVIGIGD